VRGYNHPVAGLTESQRRALEASGCEVRWDGLTRMLYAVDASIYRIEPAAVAFPRSTDEVAGVLRAAAGSGLEINPRGAGTGLAGGSLGPGLVVELARYNRRISAFDVERKTVTVGAGVVLDQLNAFLAPHSLWFGPDVATSSRATLGGMVANNSSGAHSPVYGTTADHLEALEVVLADGTVAWVGEDRDGLPEQRETAREVVLSNAEAITGGLPGGLVKSWPGYGFDRALKRPGDLAQLVSGSEGTLAAVSSAVLRVVPMPARRDLAVFFFASVEEALQATVEFLDLKPAAVEHLDAAVFDQTRGQPAFAPARALLRLDEAPCEALILVELFDDDGSHLDALANRRVGLRSLVCANAAEQELVWGMRKAGLSLVTSRKGAAKPIAGVEDVCVASERLPEYVAGLREIFEPLGLEASFYGHAASGELHVRPVFDLHTEKGVADFRRVADEVSDLCRSFNGSLAAEHGVGIARSEFMEAHQGPELIEATRRIKNIFDPGGVMNPGKILADGRYRIDANLRLGAGSEIELPVAGAFKWVDRDDSFVDNLEQCNGCGGCRKDAPTMCPTFIATGEEVMSTRGRATTIRAALEGRFDSGSAVAAPELEEALSGCLSCKACKTECPSNVDMALLKAELLHARHKEHGVPLVDRMIASADWLGRLGTLAPGPANLLLRWPPARRMAQAALGIDADAPVPPFARQRFDHWFHHRRRSDGGGRRRVILWDDTWTRYHEPGVGRSAVEVLEAAGFEVALAEGRRCCGRPAASRGLLDEVRRLGEHNLALLATSEEPIVFLEPSCWSVFRDEYRQLGLPFAEEVAARCVLLEDLLLDLLEANNTALSFTGPVGEVAVHGHCHAKALAPENRVARLLELLPGASVRWLDTGCCGMAGAFGMLADNRELSRAVAAPLVTAIEELPERSALLASGTSCRHQIAHLTNGRPLHLAEFLAGFLATGENLGGDLSV
jgi:FAD/FMN-containing dehydrogenase/Fe-S oxidoreductase